MLFLQLVSSLMVEMAAVLDLHSSPAVLEAAACSYLSLCSERAAWSSVAKAARDSLVQLWVDQLTQLLGGTLLVRSAAGGLFLLFKIPDFSNDHSPANLTVEPVPLKHHYSLALYPTAAKQVVQLQCILPLI